MQHVTDWVRVITDMTQTSHWPASGKPPATANQILNKFGNKVTNKKGGGNGGYHVNLKVAPTDFEKSDLEGDAEACEKYKTAVDLITGDNARDVDWANRKLSTLNKTQRDMGNGGPQANSVL